MSLTKIKSPQIKLSEKFLNSNNTVDLEILSGSIQNTYDNIVFLSGEEKKLSKTSLSSFLNTVVGPGLDVVGKKLVVDALEFFTEENYGDFDEVTEDKKIIMSLNSVDTYGAKLRGDTPSSLLSPENYENNTTDVVIFRKYFVNSLAQDTVEVSGFRIGSTSDITNSVISQVYLNGVMQIGKVLSSNETSIDFLTNSETTTLSGAKEEKSFLDLINNKFSYIRMYNEGSVNQKGFFIIFKTEDLNEDDVIRIIENK